MPFATACCGIELMATGASRHDLARFGAEVFRFSPRQCDLMIVAGRVVMKMVPVLQRIWLQMPEPKWCISMGACAPAAASSTPTRVRGSIASFRSICCAGLPTAPNSQFNDSRFAGMIQTRT
jgi:Ni,Fe-hydrogenase III small subunit